MAGRKNGSILISLVLGSGLIGTGAVMLGLELPGWEKGVDCFSAILFGSVLLWWAFSNENTTGRTFGHWPFLPGRNWGIGFETITMAIAVVTAAIAIFTFSHELFK